MYEHTGGEPFDLLDYFANPQNYRSKFEKYVSLLSMLINCVYWDKRYPRLVTREYLKKLYSRPSPPKLTVIGDISCDVEGAMECTLKPTTIENPLYVYNPITQTIRDGHEGDGIQIMAVDILPAELPRDSSNGFADVLVNYVKPIADAKKSGSG